jgi:exonuclease SbcC
MKILAIRGANLASIEGEFELDLARGPLSRAGVFAICGPTGAGKSTLLDAMCLALFDTAPRLEGRGRGRVGRAAEDEAERLTLSDPRSLLRKGAGQGFAEVDFEGVDGRRYRARWEVRRARNRPAGKLQPTGMSLTDLAAGQLLAGDRKTDVKAAIEARLGLSFDQFRRSVLLAQGDFAAFLDADPKDRADLLERMTGTEIYGLISQEAHARANEERRRLEALEDRLSMVRVLDDAERARAEGELGGLEIRVHEDELAARRAADAVRWHHELDALKREERAALEEAARIEAQLAIAETRRRELEGFEEARPLRPDVEAVDRTREAREARRTGLEAARREARAAVEAVAREKARAEASAAAARAAEEAREAARGPLEEARRLDRELEAAAERVAAARLRDEQATAEVERVEARVAALRAEAEAHRAEVTRRDRWLEAHPEAAALAERWARAEDRLATLAARIGEAHRVTAALSEARAAVAEAERVHARREGARRGRELRRREAELEHAALAAEVREAPSAALVEVRDGWAAERTALETLIGVAERAQEAHAAERRQRERAEASRRAADAAEAEARAAEAERGAAAARLEEAERHRDRLRATLDLSERRAELVAGEPCPLCGSVEHPFAHDAPAVGGLLAEADARLRELRDALSASDARRADARRAAAAHREAAEAAAEEARGWEAKLADAREAYRRAAAGLDRDDGAWPGELRDTPVDLPAPAPDWGPLFELTAVAPAPDGPGGAVLSDEARAALVRAREEAEAKLRALEAEERRRRERERRVERRRERFDAARRDEEQARRAWAASERALERASRERDTRQAELERLAAERDRELAALAPLLEPFEGWREALEERPEAFVEEVRAAVEARREALSAREEAQRRAQALEPKRSEAAAERRAARDKAADAAERLGAERGAEAARRLARAEVLDGADPAAVEARLTEALRSARAEASRAAAALAEAQRAEADRSAQLARAEEAAAEAEREAAEAAERLAAALAARGLTEAEVRARLAIPEADAEAWRGELARLDRLRDEQKAVCVERERKRRLHEEADPPRLGADEATRALAKAQRRAEETRNLLHAARARLAQDDEHRRRAAEVRAEAAAQRERLKVWESLADLIGSGSGNKLRVFAQSLTLELLLEHANHHLRELAPRYALQRVPGEDLALQVVDHEMGDEVRAVGSLSGGETFLVALGLALGLASLSSQRARVDSLFIDEGFGALDPASLEMVLSTLDLLQASGRQVGLISHVTTVAERFDTRVQVVAAGPARSRVELIEGLF